jgi:N-acetylglutamate synthase-like GNAT family acetyltransferase
MDTDLIYFDPISKNISVLKSILKNQGEETCQNQIDLEYINESIKQYKFGLISLSKKAQIGKRNIKNKSENYYLNGFIICYINDDEPENMIINLICSDKKAKIGKYLMKEAEEKARLMKVNKIILYSLNESNLIKWYKNLGFSRNEMIFTGKNIIKLVRMTKKI